MNNMEVLEYSILLNSTELMNEYDQFRYKTRVSSYFESDDEPQLSLLKSFYLATIKGRYAVYIDILRSVLNILNSMKVDIPETESFYTKIIDYPDFDSMKITVESISDDVVSNINPRYLNIMTTSISTTVNKILNNKINSNDLKNSYLNSDYVVKCKKRLATTKIEYLSLKEFNSSHKKDLFELNNNTIKSNILPVLRNYSVIYKEMTKLVNDTYASLIDSSNTIEDILITLANYESKGIVDKPTIMTANKFISKIISIFMEVSAYLVYAIAKKINGYSFNIQSFINTKSEILRYHPEADNILHESVLSGDPGDIDDGTIYDIIETNRGNVFDNIINSIYEKYKGDFEYTHNINLLDEDIMKRGYDEKTYKSIYKLFDDINESLDDFEELNKDSMLSVNDIIDKSNLDKRLIDKYKNTVANITNIDLYKSNIEPLYHNIDNINYNDVDDSYMVVLSELINAKMDMRNIVDMAYTVVKRLTEYYNNIEYLNPSYKVDDRKEGIKNKVKELLDDSYQLTFTIINNFLKRFGDISKLLSNMSSTFMNNPDVTPVKVIKDVNNDDEDFTDNTLVESIIGIEEDCNKYIFEEMMYEYAYMRESYHTGMRLIYEDGLATNASSNNNDNNTNNNQDNIGKSFGEFIRNLLEKIKKFFSSNTAKLNQMVENQSGNLTWLKNNRDRVISGISENAYMDILPYLDNPNIDKATQDIDKVVNSVKGMTSEQFKSLRQPSDVYKFLFSAVIGENNANVNDAKNLFVNYYQDNTGKNKRKRYSGKAQVTEALNRMFDYCIDYYETTAKSISSKLNNLQKAVDNKLGSYQNMNESVLIEADDNANNTNTGNTNNNAPTTGNDNQTTTNTTNNNNANDTKPQTGNNDNNQNNQNNNKKEKKGQRTSSFNTAKWIATGVEYFASGVINGTRNVNFDYLKCIKGFDQQPADNKNNQDNTNTENTNT